ncbi:hypothetical protein HFD88_009049 [Aspergillus terreus]|nr:hypothetical protein HFD88_009049 [Aspergillus terreus]
MAGSNNQGTISPRYLVERHFQRLRNATREGNSRGLKPGQQQLRSFLVPGLQNGTHTIDVDQYIMTAGGSKPSKPLHSSQQFTVDGPQFSLPEGEIQSVYPPQGHEAMPYVLPHVVFNTPALPWEWDVSADHASVDFTQNRNRVPWLAVLVFTNEELERPKDELQQIFGGTPPAQSSTFAVKIPVSQVANLKHTRSPIRPQTVSHQAEKDPSTDIILLDTSLFDALFTKYDRNGHGVQARYIRHHRFLAHIRDVNTKGMAVAALDATNDERSFSVVVSHRTGPFQITGPTTCYVHLVSLRGVESMKPASSDDRYVAMVSLHSWSYTCLPPKSTDVQHQFAALGKSCSPLRPNLGSLVGYPQEIVGRVQSRIDHGYSLLRYRTQTGEVTAGFMRGPFVPDEPRARNQPWQLRSLSNMGSDLQILDQQLGLMDLSYSAAWQLGRMLAIADRSFVTSLGRVRKVIYDRGLHYKQLCTLGPQGIKSRRVILRDLPKCITNLRDLPNQPAAQFADNEAFLRRWYRPADQPMDLSYHAQQQVNTTDKCQDSLDDFLNKAAKEVASAEGSPPTEPIPYNEHNTPVNVDWAIVLRWLLDRLYLVNVPSHYLITDSSHLPRESIRFFHVDRQWQEALIDGALSLANHVDQEVDRVRNAILSALQWYLAIPVVGNTTPPVPEYGCYIRSTLITKFPDLQVEVSGRSSAQAEDPLLFLRHEVINADTMICLFAKSPGPTSFTRLSLTQPPHQQSFAAAIELDNEHIKVDYKKAYTVPPACGDDRIQQPIAVFEQRKGKASPLPALYSWMSLDGKCQARTLLMDNFAQHYLGVVQGAMDFQSFDDNIATSALVASQLGDPCWRLNIDFNQSSQVASTNVTPAHSLAVGAQDSGVPSLTYTISSMAKPPGSPSTSIPMLDISQDLIFGIQLDLQTAQDWKLRWIEVSIPMGLISRDPAEPKPLMKTYTGQGATMLSNMRFNALVYRDTKTLTIKLLPRSLKGFVPAITCPELSFMLYEVHVTKFPQPTNIPVTIKEQYTQWKTAHLRELSINLVPQHIDALDEELLARGTEGRQPNGPDIWISDT